jgi:hypothetical protein
MRLQALEKNTSASISVAGCCIRQIIGFNVFVALNVFLCESLDVALHPSD